MLEGNRGGGYFVTTLTSTFIKVTLRRYSATQTVTG